VPLEPVRHRDFFACDMFTALPYIKDDMASMEHPVFSLSTKPDQRVLVYEHNGNTITIIPSTLGLATIHDKDVLLYCASYLRAAIYAGHEPSPTLRFTAHDLLTSTNRPTNDLGYERLKAALNRLRGTTINTNIKTGNVQITEAFGLINAWQIVQEDDTGRMIAISVELSKWLYQAILANELLTINRDYFRLRKPIERRLYELTRKHCGDQKEWKVGLPILQKKIGTIAPIRKTRASLREIAAQDHLPDYRVAIANDMVTFALRKAQPKTRAAVPSFLPEVYEQAKRAAPGLDVYALEAEYRVWAAGKPTPKNSSAAAFIGFCRRKARQSVGRLRP